MTIIALTRAEVAALNPCSDDKLKVFGRRRRMNARQALEAGASIEDLLWVAAKIGRKDLCVRFALRASERVAHLTTLPEAATAREAAQRWLDDPTEENRLAAGDAAGAARAAWAAGAAAWAARAAGAARAARDAAWAAAWAARAARDAAWAAAGDARAARDAAWAAAGDAGDAEREAQRAIFLEIFCPEPSQ